MKPQDIIFLFILSFVIFRRSAKLAALLGVFSLIFAIPLFASWVFFTAERLTWYAGAFFLLSIILNIISIRRSNN